jgi:hypothetical protein
MGPIDVGQLQFHGGTAKCYFTRDNIIHMDSTNDLAILDIPPVNIRPLKVSFKNGTVGDLDLDQKMVCTNSLERNVRNGLPRRRV